MNGFKSYNNFKLLVEEATQIDKKIEDLLIMPNGSLPKTSDEAALVILGKLADELPTSHKTADGYSAAFSISGYEVAYKFPTPLSFGWRIYNKNGKTTYCMRITVSSDDAENLQILEKAKEFGFSDKSAKH